MSTTFACSVLTGTYFSYYFTFNYKSDLNSTTEIRLSYYNSIETVRI